MIETLAAIADEEIERTAYEAVREAVATVGAELAFEQSLRESWQNEAERLTLVNVAMKEEAAAEKKRCGQWRTAFFVETAVLAGLVGGFLIYVGMR